MSEACWRREEDISLEAADSDGFQATANYVSPRRGREVDHVVES